VRSYLKERWEGGGGYREVLAIAIPLIISTGSWSLQHFVDRTFMAWYSIDALAAALPAGILNFTFGSFFLGVASYTNTFVAQYSGAGRERRVGASVWQGIHFSVLAGLLMLALIPAAGTIFDWVDHAGPVKAQEVAYFRMLCWMGGPAVMMAAVSAFFTGRGDTRTVMWANLWATLLNVVLDYAWIFGKWGFPEWGIEGAGAATAVAHLFGASFLLIRFFARPFRETFGTGSGWRPDLALFRRLLRFGGPNGVQFMLEVSGFTMFVLLVGRLGSTPLSATNIAFNINTLAFLPMLGMGVTVSTLVGRYIGRRAPDLAERATWSALHLALGYMIVMASLYLGAPGLLLKPYRAYADPTTFEPIFEMVIVLLYFVAAFSVLDALTIILSSALRGAGDTAFVMLASISTNWGLMVVPVYVCIVVLDVGLYVAWVFPSLYLTVVGIVYLVRFRRGRWRTMHVIPASELADSSSDFEEEGAGDPVEPLPPLTSESQKPYVP